MMEVYWLERTEADLPTDNDWLSASEAASLNGMRFAKRRDDWRLGRWTAKRAVATYLILPSDRQILAGIEIRPMPSGAPEVFIANQPAAVTVSLTHRAGAAACAIASSGVALGCDLEVIEPRSEAFIADYFTAEEQQLIQRMSATERPRLLALLWSGKESALKALRTGLRLDTRSVTVRLPQGESNGWTKDPALAFLSHDHSGWRPLLAVCEGGQIFHGWWQITSSLLRTVVASPPPLAPISLDTTVPVQSAS
ncbi:MAG: 4'-phosphopantetheinyl transferase superfamily protein [Candidatus Korobacteraceae bacterium]